MERPIRLRLREFAPEEWQDELLGMLPGKIQKQTISNNNESLASLDPNVVAALIGSGTAALVAVVNSLVSLYIARKKTKFDKHSKSSDRVQVVVEGQRKTTALYVTIDKPISQEELNSLQVEIGEIREIAI